MNSKTNIVMLSYGSEIEYRRTLFCIWSFYAWYKQLTESIRIVVYTDNPDYFKNHLTDMNVQYVLLSEELLNSLLGNSDYIHRRKIGVIDMTFQDFPNEDLLFLDSDTFFFADSQRLFNSISAEKCIMHKREYTFQEGLAQYRSFNQEHYPKAFIDYITDRDFVINGKIEHFSKYDYCWNSGVLGLNKEFAVYLPDVYKLTDAFYANSQWFISEQLAFSLILQRNAVIQPAENCVVHYWGKRQKILADKLIYDLLNKKTATDLKNTSFIRSLTKKWRKIIETDIILEQAGIALSQGHWKYGIKKSLQAIIKGPHRIASYKDLFDAVWSGK